MPNMVSVKGSCGFCGRPRNDILYGPLHKQKDVKCHYYCLLFAHVLDQNGSDDEGILGFLLPDIRQALEKGRNVRCSYCHQPGALAKCFNSKCKKTFHLPCGLERGSLHLFFGDFRSFCSEHRQKQRVPPDVLNSKDVLCSVCFDAVDDLASNDSLWAPCCKKNGWFHRLCIQKFALSAAYFFKCPLCANQKKFRDAMLKNGIYIPDQDASWELEPNAFAELLERHNKCDAAVCKCPNGREYNTDNPRLWTLMLCQNCGSKGIHTGCIPGPRSSVQNRSTWDCAECQTVMRNCSLQREEILSMSRQSVSDDDEDVIIVDEDLEGALDKNENKIIFPETSASSQDVKTVLSSAIHLTSSSSAEVVDLVDDDDDIMELTSEDEENTVLDEKLHVLVKQETVFRPLSSGNSLANVPKDVTKTPESSSVFQSSSTWTERPSWSALSHEVVSPAISPIVDHFESRRELRSPRSPQSTPRSVSHLRDWKFQDSKSRRNLEFSHCFSSPCKNKWDFSCSGHHSRLSPISSGKKKLFKIKKDIKQCGKCRKIVEKFGVKFCESLFIDGWSEIFNDLKNVWFSGPVNHRNGTLLESCDKLCRYPMSFSSFKSGKCGNARLKMHWLNMSKWVSSATSSLCVLKCRHTKVRHCQSLKNDTFKKDLLCDIRIKDVHAEEMYEVFVKKLMMEFMC